MRIGVKALLFYEGQFRITWGWSPMNSNDRKACKELRESRFNTYPGIDAVYMYWRGLKMTVRVAKAMAYENIKTIEELKQTPLEHVYRMPNVGATSIAQMQQFANWSLEPKLSEHGFHLVPPKLVEQIKEELRWGTWKYK
jgi:DNA-directed RNA polymerase alpha subunit